MEGNYNFIVIIFYRKKFHLVYYLKEKKKNPPKIRPFDHFCFKFYFGKIPKKFQIDFLFENSFELRRSSTFEWLK